MEIKCRNCGSNKFGVFHRINGYLLIKCKKCSLLMTQLSHGNKLREINKKKYNEKYLLNYLSRIKKLKKRFGRRVNEIETFVKGGTLLDVGCSTGLFLKTVSEQSSYQWKLFGIDINKRSVELARTRVDAKIMLSRLENVDIQKEYFECISCFDVIEHVPNLNSLFERIHKMLKRNGVLVIQVPNYRSLMAVLAGSNWDWWCVPDHLSHFSPGTIKALLENRGFKVIKLFTWEPIEDFVLNVLGTIKKNFPKDLFVNKIAAKICLIPLYLLWFLVKPIKEAFNLGGLIVVYAQKRY